MRSRFWPPQRAGRISLAAGLLLAVTLGICPAAEKQAPATARVEELVARLGSVKYAERRAAARALEKLGSAGLPALLEATRSPDAEVRRLAGHLVEIIRKREERDRLLAPTRVRLKFRDEPVTEAVAELAKKTGLPVSLRGYLGRLAGHKITLDTGETTFWQALDQLCQKAELSEEGQVLFLRANAVRGVPSRGTEKPHLYLEPVKLSRLPTCYFKGMRVRALPPSASLESLAGKGSPLLVLEAALEPKLRLHKLAGVRIDRAADAEGRPVTLTEVALQLPQQQYGYSRLPTPSYAAPLEAGMKEGNFRRLLLRVKGGGKKLKELRGTLFAEVQQDNKPVITVENILKAEGKSFSTYDGTALKITGVDHKKDGGVTIQLNSSVPLGGGINAIQMGNGVVRVRRLGNPDWETIGIDPAHLRLYDSAGKPFEQAGHGNSGINFQVGNINQNLHVTFRPGKGQKAPAKLVFYGTRTTVVDVPFTLKDVALK